MKPLIGHVIKTQPKTVVVAVETKWQHPLYKKTVKRTKKYLVHDEQNSATIGQIVHIYPSRPISRLKRWTLKTTKSSKSSHQ